MGKGSLSLLFLLGSCSYNWSPELSEGNLPAIVIPYVIGDDEGTFTAELIRTITASGVANVQPYSGTYQLRVVLFNDGNERIGFRKSKQKVRGKVSDNLIATEGRRKLMAKVTLYENNTDVIAKGPYNISASADYDYLDGDSIEDLAFTNSEGERTTALSFSLGQLEPIDSAQAAARDPLYKKLSQNVVDTIFNGW